MTRRKIVLSFLCLGIGIALNSCKKVVDRASYDRLIQCSTDASVTIYPTFVRRVGGPAYDRESASQLAAHFKAAGIASVHGL